MPFSRLFFPVLLVVLLLLTGCVQDSTIRACRQYIEYLDAIEYLFSNIDSEVLLIYPFIWGIIVVRKMFFV